MSNLFNKRDNVQRLSSADVVASGVDFGLFSLRYNPQLSANVFPTSAISSAQEIGRKASRYIVEDTKRSKTGLELQLEPRSPQSVPTADFISTTSYKKDAKLVIRMIPTASLGKQLDDKARQREEIDPRMSFDKFSLQAVAENDDERYQLHETFDDATLFLFGRRPRIWTYQGLVLNGRRPDIPDFLKGDDTETTSARDAFQRRFNMDFANELLRRYDRFYRGTRAVELRARTYIVYDDVIVEGTLLSMVLTRNSSIPGAANVAFTVVVHQRAFIGTSLTNTAEQTLSALISGTKRKFQVSNIIAPAMVPPRNTFSQLQAEFDDNQVKTLGSQDLVDRLQRSRDAILLEQERLDQQAQEAAEEVTIALEALAQADDQEDTDAAQGLLDRATAKKDDANAQQQHITSTLSQTEDDLAKAVEDLNEDEERQQLLKDQAESSGESPRFTCPEGFEPGTVTVVYDFTNAGVPRVRLTVFPDGAIGPNGEKEDEAGTGRTFSSLQDLVDDLNGVFLIEEVQSVSSLSKSSQAVGCLPAP